MRKHRLKWFKDNIGKQIYRHEIPILVTRSNFEKLYDLQDEELMLFSNTPKFLNWGRKHRKKS